MLAWFVLSTVVATSLPTADIAAQDRSNGVAPTFSRDVAPIVFSSCSPCHRPGESGPFDLLSYRDLRARGRLIVDAVRRRYMPPWKPAAGVEGGGPFAGERRLTDAQIDVITRWVEQGMLEGNP